ncbi:MAG: DAHL domain-containing protein, partial [Candidatus Binatia bacterium]
MRTTWPSVVIVVGLLGLLTYLLQESRSHDLTVRGRVQEAVQTLALHDAELTRDVLLARAGLLPNYDAVAQTSQELSQDSDALRQEMVTVSDLAAKALLDQRVAALATALQNKRDAVEDFKSANAILRNSLLYLTHALAHRSGHGETEAAQAWSRLSSMLLRYLQLSESRVGNELPAVLDQLLPSAAADREIHTAVRHLQLVVT